MKVVGGVLIACILLAAVIIGAGNDSADKAISSAQSADTQKPAEVLYQKAGFGEPVELAGMTFVVEKLAVAPSIPVPNDQPLQPPAGKRLWVLTVSVRNDEETPAPEPFCHLQQPSGTAVLTDKTRSGKDPSITHRAYPWSEKSLLIDANHQLCNDIQPGSTETFQLLFVISKRNPTIEEVGVSHRSASTRLYSWAFVAV